MENTVAAQGIFRIGKNTKGLSAIDGAALAIKAVEEILESVEVSFRLRDYGLRKEERQNLARKSLERVSPISFLSNSRNFNDRFKY